MNSIDFSSLNLHPALLKNLTTLGYHKMTPIQEQSLPPILEGKDIIAQGKTGSGKTAAFGLGLLEKLDVKRFRIQTLVLCPTRELADQVANEIRRLGRFIHNIKVLTLCGGMPFGPQKGSLEHGAHIVVGTPGRIEEHLRKGNFQLQDLSTFVLDEADRMLEMGFQESLDAIIEHMPSERQTMLFSATFPEQIQSISKRIMNTPVRIQVASTHDHESIRQFFYKVEDKAQRMKALRLILHHHQPESAVIFCATKLDTREVAEELKRHQFSALALHGDLEQRERNQVLVRFSNKSASILVATDVAARGLDIDSLDAVINFHLARDPEVHVHRIGRTGRAGSKGIACSFYQEKETQKITRIESYLDQKIEADSLPDDKILHNATYEPSTVCLQIDGGKKDKLRPGDILGALTGKNGIAGSLVGKINVFDHIAYVAVDREVAKSALKKLNDGRMKGRTFKVRRLGR